MQSPGRKKIASKNLNTQNAYIILQGTFVGGQLYTTNLPFEYKCGLFDTIIADKQKTISTIGKQKN